MTRLVLSGLYVYPVKSLRGIPLSQAHVSASGLALDRHWMLVDHAGRVITQIEQPRMATIDVAIEPDALRIEAAGLRSLRLPLRERTAAARDVKLFRRPRRALAVSTEADLWFRDFLGVPCTVVRLLPDDIATFANQRPVHVLGEATCEDLGRRVGAPIPLTRFRPNFVFSGGAPGEEDGWEALDVGALPFRVTEPAVRCAVTTVDSATGTRGVEPLRTLNGYRATRTLAGRRVHFGQYLTLDNAEGGEVRVGDEIRIRRPF